MKSLLKTLGFIIIVSIIISLFVGKNNTDSNDDTPSLTCRFCQKNIIGEKGKSLDVYFKENGNCGVKGVYSGSHFEGFCSRECCSAYPD